VTLNGPTSAFEESNRPPSALHRGLPSSKIGDPNRSCTPNRANNQVRGIVPTRDAQTPRRDQNGPRRFAGEPKCSKPKSHWDRPPPSQTMRQTHRKSGSTDRGFFNGPASFVRRLRATIRRCRSVFTNRHGCPSTFTVDRGRNQVRRFNSPDSATRPSNSSR